MFTHLLPDLSLGTSLVHAGLYLSVLRPEENRSRVIVAHPPDLNQLVDDHTERQADHVEQITSLGATTDLVSLQVFHLVLCCLLVAVHSEN